MATKSTQHEVVAFLFREGYNTVQVDVDYDGDEGVVVDFEDELDFDECKDEMEKLVEEGRSPNEDEDDYAVQVVSKDSNTFEVL
jgi:hypothetical protein